MPRSTTRRHAALSRRAIGIAIAAASVLATIGLAPPGAAAWTAPPAAAFSNITAYDTCDGTPDTISRSLATLAQQGFTYLGYTTATYTMSGFTRARVLARAPTDQAVYVHSHGDQYYDPYPRQVQGFREDSGDCSQGIIYAPQLATVRAPVVHLVIMSTCHLAEAARTAGQPTMAAAYGIARVKYSDPNGPDAGSRFYLGYEGVAYTVDMLHFEQHFWGYVTSGHLLGDAFTLARVAGGVSRATVPDWFGTYDYSGVPGGAIGCIRCL